MTDERTTDETETPHDSPSTSQDPRHATIANVLRDTASTQGPDDTDTVATMIVNALDREHGAADQEATTSDTPDAPNGDDNNGNNEQ